MEMTTAPARKLKLPAKDDSVNQVPLAYKHPGHIYTQEDDIKDPVVLQLKLFRNMLKRKELIRMSEIPPPEDPKKTRPTRKTEDPHAVPKGMTTDHNGHLLKIKSQQSIAPPQAWYKPKEFKNIQVNNASLVTSKPLSKGRSNAAISSITDRLKDVIKH